MLRTMPDLRWTVTVDRWSWVYTFSRFGNVSWRDPVVKEEGRGTWKIVGDKMITRWANSKTWEEWDVPLDPSDAWGTCHMDGTPYVLRATALNYYLNSGDVVYAGERIINTNGAMASIVYDDEVRSGGTVAWICRNPGNIRDGDKFGAYKGKRLTIPGAGQYAIFPDETTGLMAVVKVLRGFGAVSLLTAMKKYAPSKDGRNDPEKYARTLASGLKISTGTMLTSLSDEQIMRMAELITGVETTTEGTRYVRNPNNSNLPDAVRLRLE